jgi:hypothetical protein
MSPHPAGTGFAISGIKIQRKGLVKGNSGFSGRSNAYG